MQCSRAKSMHKVDRRAVLGGIAAFSLGHAADAAAPENVGVAADGGDIALFRYAADHVGQRAGILVLHGSGGIERKPRAYQRYADALNASGVDVYLVRYFTASDVQALDPKTSARPRREAYETERFEGWAKRVSSVVTPGQFRPHRAARLLAWRFHRRRHPRPGTIASRRWPCSTAECRTR
jgi:carboxymethylenebutenolidase